MSAGKNCEDGFTQSIAIPLRNLTFGTDFLKYRKPFSLNFRSEEGLESLWL
jgi:hypothetical protein